MDLTTKQMTREQAVTEAMEEVAEPREVAGLMLRPFSSFSWDRCMRLGIRLALESDEVISQLPTPEVLHEIALIAWMQSADPREVAKAFRSGDDEVWMAVELFEIEFNERPNAAQDWEALANEVGRTLVRAKLLLFSLIESEHVQDGERPPGNS